MGKSKIAALCLIFILVGASVYFWSQRIVELKIASATFHVPNSAIISASAMRATSGDLDSTQGAFLEFPNGPYYGKWGILLQSSKERKAKGFPSPFDTMIDEKSLTNILKKTEFGWYKCIESCGRDTWYFKRAPAIDDSIYSANSIVCHETEICELLFAFHDVDVTVSIQKGKIQDVPQAMERATALISKFYVTGN